MRAKLSRIVVSTLLLLTLAAGFAPAVGASPQPDYVECSTTVWHVYDTAIDSYQGVSVTAYLEILEDSHNFQYCGAVRTRVDFTQTSGCRHFYADVGDANNGIHVRNSVYSCANGGNLYTATYYPSLCVIGEGYTTESPYNVAQTGLFCG